MDRLNWYQEMGWSYKESQHKITFWSFNPSHDWLLRMTWSVLKSSQLWSLISFRSMFSLLEDSSHVWAPRSVTGSLLGHVNPAAIPEMWGSSFSYRLVHCWLRNNSPQKTCQQIYYHSSPWFSFWASGKMLNWGFRYINSTRPWNFH